MQSQDAGSGLFSWGTEVTSILSIECRGLVRVHCQVPNARVPVERSPSLHCVVATQEDSGCSRWSP